MTLADGSMFYGSNTLLVFLPFVLAGAGLAFVVRAAGDKVDRRTDERTVRQLPTKELYPLYHVHIQIRAAAVEAAAAAKAEDGDPPPSRPRVAPSGRNGLKLADGG